MSANVREFGKWRSILWPIHGHELKKFMPMGIMMMFILFNYTIMRDTKDSLINNSVGPEAFSFLKLYGTLPFAVLFMLGYSKLSNMMNKHAVFHTVFIFFMVFFAIFGFIIYPNSEFFHPNPEWIAAMVDSSPRLATMYKVFGSWSHGLFYIMSELFGTAGISLLFWRFANDVVCKKKGETFRFYPLFGLVGNFALIISGEALKEFSKVPKDLPLGMDPFVPALQKMTISIIICCLLTMIIYQWMQKKVFTDPKYLPESTSTSKKKKPKLSVMEGIKYVFQSKHLGYIAMLVICYGTTLAITEAVWKSQIKLVYPDKNSYTAFMGLFSQVSGIVTIIMMLVGSNFMRKFGWKMSALITPVLLLLTGVPFFIFIMFKSEMTSFCLRYFSTTPTNVALWLGFYLVIFVKAAKYALFDPTKEMSYLSLDDEGRNKGKAAVDVVGGRAGKSSGAAIQQFLFMAIGVADLAVVTPHLGVILGVVGLCWCFSAIGLHNSIITLNKNSENNQAREDLVGSTCSTKS